MEANHDRDFTPTHVRNIGLVVLDPLDVPAGMGTVLVHELGLHGLALEHLGVLFLMQLVELLGGLLARFAAHVASLSVGLRLSLR